MAKIKLMLVDDHRVLLEGIASLLQGEEKVEITGKATSAKELLHLMELNTPDILLTDINMPGISGTELARQVKELYPSVKIITLSMHDEASIVTEMLQAGASGYILKNTGKEELMAAIEKVFEGGVFYSSEVSDQMLRKLSSKSDDTNDLKLTPREIEIVKLIAQELSNAQIGDKLFISERTVETHRKNIFRKTNSKTVVGLIRYAMEHKLID